MQIKELNIKTKIKCENVCFLIVGEKQETFKGAIA